MANTGSTAKVALITGGACRVGAVIARSLHERNFTIVVHYRHSEKAALALVAALNGLRKNSAHLVQADFSHSEGPEICIQGALDKAGRLDLLVNNASVYFKSPVAFFKRSDWDALMMTNLQAPYQLSLVAAAALMKTGGNIVNIADRQGEIPKKDYAIYGITQAGLLMVTKALAMALAPKIRVNAVLPGPVLPAIDDQSEGADFKKLAKKNLLGRLPGPEAVAQAVYYLAEEAFDQTGVLLPLYASFH